MTSYRNTIRDLALSTSVSQGTREVAERVATRARQIDPSGEFVVQPQTLVVNGMPRRVWIVANTAPGAARSEFGRVRDGGSGAAGLRPLGRAARSVK